MDAIYFDERIDTTVIREVAKTKFVMGRGVEEEASTSIQCTAKEEHCPVIMYGPAGEFYIETHKLEEGTGRVLGGELTKSLQKQRSNETVKVIGSDSCSKNTGHEKGAQACVEEQLGRPLQRVLCLKHTIEIVWHKFFKSIDGKSSSPTTLTGPIGKWLCNETFYCENVVNFARMRPKKPFVKLSKEVIAKMSANQAYLYRIVQAIINGSKQFQVDKGLLTASPGKFHNARWMTLANRILRLYCSDPNPNVELKLLVRFLIDVYSPTWFDVVQNPSFLDGPKIFHRLVVSLDTFTFKVEQKKIMESSIN